MRKLLPISILLLLLVAGACDTPIPRGKIPPPFPDDFVVGRVLVKPKAGISAQSLGDIEATIPEIGVSALRLSTIRGSRGKAATLNYLAALQRDPTVEWAELDWVVRIGDVPNDPRLADQWHLAQIQAYDAWDISTGAGVRFAVVDTGADGDHPDLNIVAEYDYVNDDDDADDGHGDRKSVV